MTESAAQPPPVRPPRRPTPKRGICRVDGAADVIIAADGMCWAHYARSRRPHSASPADTPALEQERRQHLAAIQAARRRVQDAVARQQTARRLLRTRVRLAYADTSGDSPGLSYNQIGDLLDAPPMVPWKLVTGSLSRPPGPPTRAPAGKVAIWRGPITEADQKMDAANDAAREARAQLRELLVAATDPQDPARVSVERVAAELGVSFGAVLRWRGGRHPARKTQPEESAK